MWRNVQDPDEKETPRGDVNLRHYPDGKTRKCEKWMHPGVRILCGLPRRVQETCWSVEEVCCTNCPFTHYDRVEDAFQLRVSSPEHGHYPGGERARAHRSRGCVALSSSVQSCSCPAHLLNWHVHRFAGRIFLFFIMNSMGLAPWGELLIYSPFTCRFDGD